jgi:hypothetical protein
MALSLCSSAAYSSIFWMALSLRSSAASRIGLTQSPLKTSAEHFSFYQFD